MLDSASRLSSAGIALHWLKPRDKAPVDTAWSTAPVHTPETLAAAYKKGMNLGVRLGEYSCVDGAYLHIIDVDIRDNDLAREAVAALKEFIPEAAELPRVKSGSGGKSFHLYFFTDRPFTSKKLARSEGFTMVWDERKQRDVKKFDYEIELFGTGKQAAMPPSIHPDTGNPYKWVKELDLDQFELGLTPHFIDSDRVAEWTQEDARREFFGEVKPHLGLTVEEARDILKWLPLDEWCEDHYGWFKVGMALHHEFDGGQDGFDLWCDFAKQSDKFNAREHRNRWRSFGKYDKEMLTMASLMDATRDIRMASGFDAFDDDEDELEEVVDEMPDTPKKAETPSQEKVDEDAPDLSIIQRFSKAAPKLPVGIMPTYLEHWCRQAAKATGAPEDFIFFNTVTCAAAAIGNARVTRVKESWKEPTIIWTLDIGDPSTNKSPSMRPFRRAMSVIENRYIPGFEDSKRTYESDKRLAAMARKQWEQESEKCLQNGLEPDPMPDEAHEPPKPVCPRLIIDNITPERVIQLAANSPRGLIVANSEGAEFMKSMDAYSASKGRERAMWLRGYDGDPVTVDRVKDDGRPIKVDRFSTSMLLATQPDVLAEMKDDKNDGFLVRFIPVWPDHPKKTEWSDEQYDEVGIENMFLKLASLDMPDDEGVEIPLSTGAKKVFSDWYSSGERHRLADDAFGTLKDAFGKSAGLILRISLVLTHLDWAVPFGEQDEPEAVSESAMRRALNLWLEYIRPMQERTFGLHQRSKTEQNAASLALWIKKSKSRTFTVTDVRRQRVIPGVSDSKQVEEAIAHLSILKWVASDDSQEKRSVGRPSKKLKVNPKLWNIIKRDIDLD